MAGGVHPALHHFLGGAVALGDVFHIGQAVDEDALLALRPVVGKIGGDLLRPGLGVFHRGLIHHQRLQAGLFPFLIGQAEHLLPVGFLIVRAHRVAAAQIDALLQAAVKVELMDKPLPLLGALQVGKAVGADGVQHIIQRQKAHHPVLPVGEHIAAAAVIIPADHIHRRGIGIHHLQRIFGQGVAAGRRGLALGSGGALLLRLGPAGGQRSRGLGLADGRGNRAHAALAGLGGGFLPDKGCPGGRGRSLGLALAGRGLFRGSGSRGFFLFGFFLLFFGFFRLTGRFGGGKPGAGLRRTGSLLFRLLAAGGHTDHQGHGQQGAHPSFHFVKPSFL